MILKGPDVRARTLVVPHTVPGLSRRVRVGSGGTPPAAAPVASPEDEATRESAQQALLRTQAEAERIVAKAKAEAERLQAQAQVELGRAKTEAEQLVAEARARLEEAGETVTTLSEARQIMAEHQAEAAQIVAEAEAQRQALFDEARAKGFEEGRAAGYEEGTHQARAELSELLELAHGVAAQAKVDREALIASAEPEVVRLAMEVARKLVAREVEADSNILQGLLTRAMLKAAGDGPIRLRLNPQTIDRLGSFLLDTTSRFASRGVEVIADPSVEPAGAMLDTRTGAIDARLSTQLDKVERTLLSLTGETP